MLAVLGTVAAWYVGDALYNDYGNDIAKTFTAGVLLAAWWEVAWFIVAFCLMAPFLHRNINGGQSNQSSQILTMLRIGTGQAQFQFQLNQMFWGCASVWLILVGLAAIKLGAQIPYYFFPFLGYKVDPWGRGQIGGGIDALLSLAGYFQMFIASVFGVVAALAQDRRVRNLALAACLLAWPYYFFDRVRNNMLAVLVPAILAWVFLRLRGGLLKKIAILGAFFILVSLWFDFVIANRSNTTIAAAVHGDGINITEAAQQAHHEGLNMFEELCWINTFMENGTYNPNWGARYFEELANPVPRALWPGKPMIGLDYAEARGQAYQDDGTVTATISTGMIGQGVVNFGRIFGPAFAAFLMGLWAAMLANLDLNGEKIGRIPLYALGLILTFNLGRDITFITLYTFAFGSMVVWWLGRRASPQPTTNAGEESVYQNRPTKLQRRRAARKNRRVGPESDHEQSLQEAAPYSVTAQGSGERKAKSEEGQGGVGGGTEDGSQRSEDN
jgi:hypothetical protein